MGQNKRTNTRLKVFVLLLMLVLFSFSAAAHYVVSSINSRNPVDLETIKMAQTVVFYKDDCPDCKKVLPKMILKNIFTQDSVFINLNNQKNRRYIRIYELKEVPTIVEQNSKEH